MIERSSKRSFISVVLTFYNEEDIIPELVKRLRKILSNLVENKKIEKFELIFVNDDSSDNSEEKLIELSENNDDIKIVNMSRNFGMAECLLAGMEYAKGDAIVYMATDLQDPPEVIPEMIKAWEEGDKVDVVHTKRISRAGEPALKMFLTRIGYELLHKMSEVNHPIEVSEFKLLSRRVVNYLLMMKEKKPYIRGLVSWIGFNQVYVPYHREPRYSGESKFPMFGPRVLWDFLESALISFSSVPLKIMIVIGSFVSFFSFLMLCYVTIQKFVIPGVTQGWTTLISLVLLLGGIQLLSLGIVGLYINIIFIEAKGRPRHIVKDTFGFPDN